MPLGPARYLLPRLCVLREVGDVARADRGIFKPLRARAERTMPRVRARVVEAVRRDRVRTDGAVALDDQLELVLAVEMRFDDAVGWLLGQEHRRCHTRRSLRRQPLALEKARFLRHGPAHARAQGLASGWNHGF